MILHISSRQAPLYTFPMPRPRKYKLKPLGLDTEPIGVRLKHFRKLRGLTQAEVAAKIGITRGSLAAYETGRVRVVDEMIVRFALALGVSADKLLGISAQRPENPSALRIMRRLKKIERLPPAKQKAILQTLDMALQNVEPERTR
jgi:transcriptional regulator with XRE-family HTH domain